MPLTRRSVLLLALALGATACAPTPPPTPTAPPPPAPTPTRKPVPTIPAAAAAAATMTPRPDIIDFVTKAKAAVATVKDVTVPPAPEGDTESGLIYPPCGWSPRKIDKVQPILLAAAADDLHNLKGRYYVTKYGVDSALGDFRGRLTEKDGWTGGLAPVDEKSWLGKFTNTAKSDVGYIYIWPDPQDPGFGAVQILEKNADPEKPMKSSDLGC
jgi:hypothetical protein